MCNYPEKERRGRPFRGISGVRHVQILVAAGQDTAKNLPVAKKGTPNGESIEIEHIADRVLARFAGDNGAPDALLLDFQFPGLAGLSGIRTAVDAIGDRPLGVLLQKPTPQDTHTAFAAGANAVLTANLPPQAFSAALTMLYAGVSFAIFDHTRLVTRLQEMSTLSAREIEVLNGICHGLQNKEIAHAFNIQEVTVKMHVRSIIRKLAARNRTHAAMLARDLGIV